MPALAGFVTKRKDRVPAHASHRPSSGPRTLPLRLLPSTSSCGASVKPDTHLLVGDVATGERGGDPFTGELVTPFCDCRDAGGARGLDDQTGRAVQQAHRLDDLLVGD